MECSPKKKCDSYLKRQAARVHQGKDRDLEVVPLDKRAAGGLVAIDRDHRYSRLTVSRWRTDALDSAFNEQP